MISYGVDADAPPAGLPPAAGRVASKRSSLMRRSRPVQQDIGQNNEETETAETADRPPSLPDADFETRLKPLRPGSVQYPPSRIQRSEGEPRQAISNTRKRNIPADNFVLPRHEPVQPPDVGWEGGESPSSVEPIAFRADETGRSREVSRLGFTRRFGTAYVGPIIYSDAGRGSAPAEWPDLPAVEAADASIGYTSSVQDSATAAEHSRTTTNATGPNRRDSGEATRQFSGTAIMDWPASTESAWPDLPEETVSNEDAELRVTRALERRMRLDREQSGLPWNAQLF